MGLDPEKTSRRTFLATGVTLAATAAAAVAGMGMRLAPAKLSKAALHYRNTPVGGKAAAIASSSSRGRNPMPTAPAKSWPAPSAPTAIASPTRRTGEAASGCQRCRGRRAATALTP